MRSLRTSGPAKTVTDSRARYEQYDDREQRDYETRSRQCTYRGRVVVLPMREIRKHYLDALCAEFDSTYWPARVLEVGCGNCINLVELHSYYRSSVELHGIDVSGKRLDVARGYFGVRLSRIKLQEASITQRTSYPDGHFDIVFSMFCLEQIAYETRAAVAEMLRLARRRVIMIEPVFELGRLAEKLYLYNADHGRILLKSIAELGVTPTRVERLDIQDNPVNQSSIIVIDR